MSNREAISRVEAAEKELVLAKKALEKEAVTYSCSDRLFHNYNGCDHGYGIGYWCKTKAHYGGTLEMKTDFSSGIVFIVLKHLMNI